MASQTLPAAQALQGIRRRGLLAQVLVAATILLVVLGVIVHRYLSDRYSADGTALAFTSALSQRDAYTAWPLLVIDGQAQIAGASNLLTEPGLRAQLAQPSYQLAGISNLRISSHRSLGDGVLDTVTFTRAGKSGSLDLLLVEDLNSRHFLFYPSWHVVEEPVVLTLKAPSGAGAISFDGIPLTLSSADVVVLPGGHQIKSAPTATFNAATSAVEAGAAGSGAVLISPTLTATAAPTAAAAIKAAFAACHDPGISTPCPNQLVGQPITWEVIGDPTADIAYSVATDGQLQGEGHYQMFGTVSFAQPEDRSHTFAGGPYTARLQVEDGVFSVTSLSDGPATLAAVVRPAAASDDAVKAAVKTAFNSCAAAIVVRPIDCPQVAHSNYGTVQNLKWTLAGDPSAGAMVTFDTGTGLVHLRGTYSMSASYDVAVLGTSSHQEETDARAFDALVVWDSGNPRVIQINAVSS